MKSESGIWCRHFTGIQHKQCEAGIRYDSLYDKDASFSQRRIPCLYEDSTSTCQHYEAYTAEEIATREREVAEFISQSNAFWTRDSEACPQCGKHVTSCKQVGRCVYAYPCGCRAGQGRLHANWKTEAS